MANLLGRPRVWLSIFTCALTLRTRTDRLLERASLKFMKLSAPATLLYLWLLPRSRAAETTVELAEKLGLSPKTIVEARQELVAAGLLRAERESVLEALSHYPLRKDLFPNWKPKRVKLPEDLLRMSPATKALYLYVAGRPGVTRSQIAADLDMNYDTVLRATNKLEPWLETEGANPIRYQMKKAKL